MADFVRKRRLGEGNFGEVWLVFDRALGVDRAVKYVSPAKIHSPTEFYHEPRTLMQLRHDNIVRVEDAGTTADGKLYIAMEYIQRGSLDDIFNGQPIPLMTARRMLCEVCWGLEYAHQSGYIHRDIKPKNILVHYRRGAILSDFGLATRNPRGEGASPYGYLTHLAPEVFKGDKTTALSDVYALGVTAYRMVNGDALLPSPDTETDFLDMVLDGTYPDRKRYRPYIPTVLRRVINKAMCVDPKSRFQRAADFRLALERVAILCTWKWKFHRGRTVYTTNVKSCSIKVECKQATDSRFSIVTTKRGTGGQGRRVSADCRSNLTLTQMRSFLHKILSRYVTNGR